MTEEWIVFVEGREYGPVDLSGLLEWKEEGRVLPKNQARRSDTDVWVTASEIPGLFESVASETQERPVEHLAVPRSLGSILGRTFRIYGQGFFQFFGLSLLIIIPSACAQLTGAVLEASPTVDVDLRTLLAGGFTFCMLLLTVALWPIYIAGIQILTADLEAGHRAGFFAVLNEAIRFWMRIALLCIFVYGSYIFWTLLPLSLMLVVVVSGFSLASTFVALALLAFQVWMVGRLFINFLFWQQCAVLSGTGMSQTLGESKFLARGARDLAWYKRPLWRGVFISSLWVAFVIALNLPWLWPALRIYFHGVLTAQDPQAMLEAMKETSKAHGSNMASFAIGFVQSLLRPLLGIAFVLLYFDAKAATDAGETPP